MQESVVYPQYRKYPNNKAYFKISSSTEWEEIQIIGSTYILHHFTVRILPDRNYIYDMTFDYYKNWVKIEEEEYQEIKENISTKGH
jgi:hypothetical protein